MGVVTEAGFYGGKFLKAGQFYEAEVETGVSAPSQAEPDLASMTKAELVAEAERRGVDIDAGDTKADIVKALEA